MGRILTEQGITYTDISFSLASHPRTKDLVRVKDSEAIKQAVFNIINTNPGEVPFNPDFGTNIRELLFEDLNQATSVQIRNRIQIALENFEPRITVNNINIKSNTNSHSYDIEINYLVDSTQRTDTVPIRLKQVR